VPEKFWNNYLKAATAFSDDKNNYREKLGALKTRLLVISGDHDIACPIENWYALTRKMPNMQIIMLPDSGHGPQHQHPQLSVKYINAFLERANLMNGSRQTKRRQNE
jgi:pimeloyl-ACP methyl ester carboxylesterase